MQFNHIPTLPTCLHSSFAHTRTHTSNVLPWLSNQGLLCTFLNGTTERPSPPPLVAQGSRFTNPDSKIQTYQPNLPTQLFRSLLHPTQFPSTVHDPCEWLCQLFSETIGLSFFNQSTWHINFTYTHTNTHSCKQPIKTNANHLDWGRDRVGWRLPYRLPDRFNRCYKAPF